MAYCAKDEGGVFAMPKKSTTRRERQNLGRMKMKNAFMGATVSLLLAGCASINLDGDMSLACHPDLTPSLAVAAATSDALQTYSKPKPQALPANISTQSIAAGFSQAMASGFTQSTASGTVKAWAERQELQKVTPNTIPPTAVAAAQEARSFIADFWNAFPESGSTLSLAKTGPQAEGRIKTISRSDIERFSRVEGIALRGGFDALAAHGVAELQERQNERGQMLKLGLTYPFQQLLDEQEKELDTSALLSLYLSAYFRGGKIFQVTLSVEELAKALQKEIQGAMPDRPVPPRVEELIRENLLKMCKDKDGKGECRVSRALGSENFVTRAGISVQYAGVGVSVGEDGKGLVAVSHPPSTEVAPQLVRVITEAMFDSVDPRVPGVANSTLCKAPKGTCVDEKDSAAIKQLDDYGNRTEALVSSSAGKLLRGVNVVALNNEAVAKSLETFAGVTARKWLEKALWKRYEKNCLSPLPTASVQIAP
jgi:hypothetical protein